MRSCEPAPAAPGPLTSGTPVGLLAALGAAGLAAALLAGAGAPPGLVRVLGVTAGHGALLATALGWAAADAGPRGWPPGRVTAAALALLALGAAGPLLVPGGGFLALGLPAWLAVQARRDRLRPLGLGRPVSVVALGWGLGAGAVLGGHLLFSATRTLGYRLRQDDLAGYLAAVAYDLGANVPATELFFRGALLGRLQRRLAFPPAATLVTLAGLLRYLLDPLLPRAPEVLAGTVVYVPALGAVGAWLRWRSGSLLPSLLAATVFFLAYRLIVPA